MTADVPMDGSRPNLAQDMLAGADAIAEFLWGSKSYRRKVYYLAEHSRIPIFRLGSVLSARKSVLMSFIADQESRAATPDKTGSCRRA